MRDLKIVVERGNGETFWVGPFVSDQETFCIGPFGSDQDYSEKKIGIMGQTRSNHESSKVESWVEQKVKSWVEQSRILSRTFCLPTTPLRDSTPC